MLLASMLAVALCVASFIFGYFLGVKDGREHRWDLRKGPKKEAGRRKTAR